jgi:hypothetical protein
MREFLHGTHDGGDPPEAIARAIERDRRVLEDVVEVGVVFGFFRRLGGRGNVRVVAFCVAVRSSRYLSTIPERSSIASRTKCTLSENELHRRVDLVRDARGEAADAFELLRLRQSFSSRR